jgi:hypothetical protein
MMQRIRKFRFISSIFLTSLIFIFGGMVWAYFALRGVKTPLVLHFNNLAGINQIGSSADLLRFGGTAIVFIILDLFLALELETRDIFLGKLLAAAALFFSILIFIGFAAIISVN